ncbi:MAG: lipoprotein [Gallionellaceae bacterium]|nr:lipoprotein [Gallionellaceae bacterium]
MACIMLLFALALQGCGKKGPLVLPQGQAGDRQTSGAQSDKGQQEKGQQQ